MMYWNRLKSAVIICLVSLACSAVATAAVVECPILQVKLGRFYFPVGLEKYVYPNCRFTIISGSDTLFTGLIAHSYDGVSFSYESDELPDSLTFDSCQALIEQAEIDSGSTMSIGTVGRFAVLDELSSNVRTVEFPSRRAMLRAFQSEEIDAFISYQANQSVIEKSLTISSPAPYFATLIPNVGSVFNKRGFLTTSMYYCFDPERPSLYFDGDAIAQQPCLLPCDSNRGRYYRHDRSKGRRLLQKVRPRTTRPVLAPLDESLERLAGYFADILARERRPIHLNDRKNEADLYLAYLPVDADNPASALDSILSILAADTVEGRTINKAVQICSSWLEMSGEAADSTDRLLYMKRAATTLMEDISLFPLFRPSLFFTAHESIRGFQFDRSGNLELSNVVKVVLPVAIAGEDQ